MLCPANKCQQRLVLISGVNDYEYTNKQVYVGVYVCLLYTLDFDVSVIVVNTHDILCKLWLNIALQRHCEHSIFQMIVNLEI